MSDYTPTVRDLKRAYSLTRMHGEHGVSNEQAESEIDRFIEAVRDGTVRES